MPGAACSTSRSKRDACGRCGNHEDHGKRHDGPDHHYAVGRQRDGGREHAQGLAALRQAIVDLNLAGMGKRPRLASLKTAGPIARTVERAVHAQFAPVEIADDFNDDLTDDFRG